ncbi:MAG: hypothetical protein KJ077_10220 [Anaerolineae bacterium]|nr:hypothetical protein [Anaerolineae bacterium]
MKPGSRLNKLQILLLTGLVLALLGLVTPSLVLALPPRTTPAVVKEKKQDKDKPLGAYIELGASALPDSGWAVVQWQDSAGNWHDVEGWQGPLPGNTRWWVAAKDFGSGLFRWVVTQGPGGSVMSKSAPFNLPGGANETVYVQLSLP